MCPLTPCRLDVDWLTHGTVQKLVVVIAGQVGPFPMLPMCANWG